MQNNDQAYDKALIQKNLVVLNSMLDNFEKKRRQTIPTLPFKIDFEKLQKINETPVETPLKAFKPSKKSKSSKKPYPHTEENLKFKTMPCKYFHSNIGHSCGRGDACDFIHDYRYEGRELPIELYIHKRQEALKKSSAKKRNRLSRIRGLRSKSGKGSAEKEVPGSGCAEVKKKLVFSSPQSRKNGGNSEMFGKNGNGKSKSSQQSPNKMKNDPISQILEESKDLKSDDEDKTTQNLTKKKKKVQTPNFFEKTHDENDPNVIDPQELYNQTKDHLKEVEKKRAEELQKLKQEEMEKMKKMELELKNLKNLDNMGSLDSKQQQYPVYTRM